MSIPNTAEDNDLLFLDAETTGLNTRLHDVIEAAWAVGLGPVRETRFHHTTDHADPDSLRLNRYFERGLDEYAMPPGAVPQAFTALQRELILDMQGATIVAENYGFDLAMLFRKLGFEGWHYRKIELSSVAKTIFGLPRPESLTNTANRLREYGFDIPHNDHSAGADVECLRACYFALEAIREQVDLTIAQVAAAVAQVNAA